MNTPFQYTLSTHPLNTHSQPTLSTHPPTTPSHYQAFDHTERRFNDITCGLPKDKVFNQLPPPGAYDPRTEFAHSLAKVNPHPTGPFGCQVH